MVVRLKSVRGYAKLDEPGLSKVVVDAARLRREEVDVIEAARAAWVAKRDLGAFHQHEWAVATNPGSVRGAVSRKASRPRPFALPIASASGTAAPTRLRRNASSAPSPCMRACSGVVPTTRC